MDDFNRRWAWGICVMLCGAFLLISSARYEFANSPGDKKVVPIREFVLCLRGDACTGGLLSKGWSYLIRFTGPLGGLLSNGAAVWASKHVQPVKTPTGSTSSVLSVFRHSVESWRRPGRERPAVTSATETHALATGFTNEGTLSPLPFSAKLSLIVGTVLDEYYAASVVAEKGSTFLDVLEQHVIMLVRSLTSALKERLCVGGANSLPEQKFCNLFKSHPRLATLMIFTKADVNPVGVALMRISRAGQYATPNDNAELLGDVHQVERLVSHLSLQMRAHLLAGVSHKDEKHGELEHEEHNWFGLHVEHEWQHSWDKLGPNGEGSCEKCFQGGILRILKEMRFHQATMCQSATCPKLISACKLSEEHRYLVQTYLVLKIKLLEIVSFHCAQTCGLSPMFQSGKGFRQHVSNLGLQHLKGELVSGQGEDITRLLETQRRDLFKVGYASGMDGPKGHANHPVDRSEVHIARALPLETYLPGLRHQCNKQQGKRQAYKGALHLRGHIFDISKNSKSGRRLVRTSFLTNRQTIGPNNFRDLILELRHQMSMLKGAARSSEPETLSDLKTGMLLYRRPKFPKYFRISAKPRGLPLLETSEIVDNKNTSGNLSSGMLQNSSQVGEYASISVSTEGFRAEM